MILMLLIPKIFYKSWNMVTPNKIIIGHLNINSIRYKFEFLKKLIGNNIDIFLISETKLNDTFSLRPIFDQWLLYTFQIW